jgi:peptide-methionine (S)-S-oxide reductase
VKDKISLFISQTAKILSWSIVRAADATRMSVNGMSCDASSCRRNGESFQPSRQCSNDIEDGSGGDDEEHESCPLLKPTPSVPEHDMLVVGCGCFWTGQLKCQRLDGVIEVVAGYAGGHQPNPTYDDILDHSEALRIEYDPSQISLRQMLHAWTKIHKPEKLVGRRYRSVAWYTGEEQRIVVEEVVREWRKEHGEKKTEESSSTLYTTVEPVTDFYRAESYHQDYYIRTGQARFVR